MRAMIFEQWAGGHYYNYIECLALYLARFADEVIVVTTEPGATSSRFAAKLHALQGYSNIRFDLCVPELPRGDSPALGLAVSRHAKQAILRNRPDYVFLTTADEQFFWLPLIAGRPSSSILRHTRIEGILHHKIFRGGETKKARILSAIRRAIARSRTFSQLNFVNYLLYEGGLEFGAWWSKFARVAGDPVPTGQKFSKLEARRSLGIEEDGRYLGMVGDLGGRKAVAETLAAFRSAKLRNTDRLLLAGHISPIFRKIIESDYADLVKSDRIVILPRYLSERELWMAFSSLDVHCSVYNNFFGLSSLMLKSLAVDTPVIVADYGWCGEIARGFGVGLTTHPASLQGFSRVMSEALEHSANYHQSIATRRLLQFHSVENFCAGIAERAVSSSGKSLMSAPLPWSWVVEALLDVRHQ